MKKFLKSMAMLSVGCFCLSASAIDTVDLGAIELGKVYTVPDMCAVTGTITAPTTGTLLQDGVADINLEGLDKTWAGYGENGQVYSYQVAEGQTYTASCDFVFNGGKVVWKMQGSEALKVVNVDPREGSVISTSTNGTGDIIIQFNAVVSVSGATLTANGKSAPLHVSGEGSVKAAVNVRTALATLYADGTLNSAGNEQLTITLTGVQDSDGNLYNQDGVLTLNYVSAPKAITLVNTNSKGRQLKSYYAAGDPEGILTYEFDGDVLNNGSAYFTLAVGAPEVDGGYYYEVIQPKIEGNVVTVDLTGKLRELNHFLSMSDLPYVGAKLANVRDLSGNLSAGDSDATVGSYNAYFTYDYIEPVTISSEFVPANGASLEGVDKVEIWFNNADKINFDGVLFSCAAAKVVVPMEELEITRENNDLTIVVAVPAEVKGQKGVSVTLNNMVSLDGYDHTKQVKATYDAWVVTLVGPIQDDGTYASTGDEDFIFTMNQAYGYMRYDFYNGDEWAYGSWLTEQENGTYTSYNGNYALYKDMENRMLVRGYNEEADYWANNDSNVAEYTFYFNGLTEGFSYSDVKFLSIDPENGAEISPVEGFHFTVTFDGLVNVTDQSCILQGFGMYANFAKIVPVDPEETTGLSSVWELYPSLSDFNGTGMDISVYAYDANGKLVEGNVGGGENDYLQFSYLIYSSSLFRAVNVYPADGATLSELTQIEISNANYPVGINYSYTGDMPFISDKLGNTVYTFTRDEFKVIADPASSVAEMTYAKAVLRTPITDEGSYMLFIPEKFFMLGSQFETYYSEEVQALYNIGNGVPSASLTIEPADGEHLDQLDYIMINTEAEINTECEEYIILYSFNDWTSVGEWSQWSSPAQLEKVDGGYKLNLDEPLTQQGEYSITVPAGFFILDGKVLEGAYISFFIGEGGSQNPEATVELTLDPAPGTVTELTKIKIDAPGIADSMANWDLEITITNDKGEVVHTTTGADLVNTSFDMETWQFIGYYIDMTENPITENGVYTVNIPEGMFEFFDMSRSKALTAVYTIGSTTPGDEWAVTLVSPIQNDGTYATTGEEDFVFTMEQAYGYMRYDLYNGQDWVYGSWLTEQADGTYTSYNANWPLYKDIENRMLVRGFDNEGDYWNGAKALAQVEFFFNGLTEGFTYSDVKFVSIDPEPNSQIVPTEDFHFTLTFDGQVNITSQSCINTGFGSYVPFAKIVPADYQDGAALASVWELYPPKSTLSGTSIDISVYAYDGDGKLVEGNMGGGENDYLQFSYGVYNTSNFKPVNVYPASGATLSILDQIELSNPNYPTGVNYGFDKDMPFISDKLGNTVYTFSMNDFQVIEDPASSVREMTYVRAALRTPIETEGSYMLFIPEGFFIIGAEFETYLSQEVQALYTIGAGSGSAFLTVEPAEGANVDSLDYITITTDAVINTECEEYITLYSFSIWSDVDYWSQWSSAAKFEKTADGYKLNLDQTLTEDGEYALNIPEGFFILDGKTNEWTSVTFTVGEGGSQNQEGTVELTLDPAPGTVPEISKINITAPGIADSMANWELNITVTDEFGDVIRIVTGSELSEKSFDWNTWQFLGFYLDFTEDPITENGVYVVNIPNGMFEFFDMSRSKALTAVYTVDSTTGVSTILLETAPRYEVYTINGIKVLSTANAAELGNLNKGLYIINGKKVLIK